MLNATPFLKAYARYRSWVLKNQHPATTQHTQLLTLLRKAEKTRFGRDHKFNKIKTVAEYQSAVPLRKYEQMWKDYLQPDFPVLEDVSWPGRIPYFAVSSGTSSGTTKYIPLNKEMLQSNTKAGLDLLTFHVLNHPSSQIFGGLNFMLGGSTDFQRLAEGVSSGDLSGITVKELPFWAKPRYFPPEELAFEKDWEKKISQFAYEVGKRDIRMLGGVPAWMLILIDSLRKLNNKPDGKIVDFFPNLEMLVHGGVNFTPYLSQFQQLLEGSHAELREVYPASEGFIATADRGSGEGLRLHCDHGIFYEFVPLEELDSPHPTRHWVGNIETDVNYAIVLTTCVGLWSYIIGDTVRFVETAPPRLLITGRTSYFMSAFGEHLIAEEVEDALTYASESLGLLVHDFSMGAVFPASTGELGRHLFVVEAVGVNNVDVQGSELCRLIDQRLCARNEDYAAHRAEGFGLGLPEIKFAPEGFFAAWMKSRGKLGGQHKVPRLINKQDLFDDLLNFVESFTTYEK
jgi:hypothetical protein